jgi:hypothetical protein
VNYKDALIAVGLSPYEPRFINDREPEWKLCDPYETQFVRWLEEGSLISIYRNGSLLIGLLDMWREPEHEDDLLMVSILQKVGTTDLVDVYLTGSETVWMEVVD